jgi:hypothetical protein
MLDAGRVRPSCVEMLRGHRRGREAGIGTGCVVGCRATAGRGPGRVGGSAGHRGGRPGWGVASDAACVGGPVSGGRGGGSGGSVASTARLPAPGRDVGRGAGRGDAAGASAVGCEADPDGAAPQAGRRADGAGDGHDQPDPGSSGPGDTAATPRMAGRSSSTGWCRHRETSRWKGNSSGSARTVPAWWCGSEPTARSSTSWSAVPGSSRSAHTCRSTTWPSWSPREACRPGLRRCPRRRTFRQASGESRQCGCPVPADVRQIPAT